jgi:hypothetical protein
LWGFAGFVEVGGADAGWCIVRRVNQRYIIRFLTTNHGRKKPVKINFVNYLMRSRILISFKILSGKVISVFGFMGRSF